MRRTRSRHVGRSVRSGATTPKRNGRVMFSFRLLSEWQLSCPLVRAPNETIALDRHAARARLRTDQFERPLRPELGEQPPALTDDQRKREQVHLIDKIVLQQPPDQSAAAVYLHLAP